jgi:hypothetical protein
MARGDRGDPLFAVVIAAENNLGNGQMASGGRLKRQRAESHRSSPGAADLVLNHNRAKQVANGVSVISAAMAGQVNAACVADASETDLVSDEEDSVVTSE